MRGVLVTLVVAAGVLATHSPGLGRAAGTDLGIRRAKVRLDRLRGTARDRMKVRATFPLLQEDFDPGRDGLDFLVAGTEVLCVPTRTDGTFIPPPVEPPDYGPPLPPGVGDPVGRTWSLRENDDASFTWLARGIRVELDPAEGTISISGRGLDLDSLPDAGPGAVDLALVLGKEQFGTVIDFEQRGRSWKYADR